MTQKYSTFANRLEFYFYNKQKAKYISGYAKTLLTAASDSSST